eukprot:m.17678 g.17678  ORF g.17678 m.17678 type:complete len:78 (+) comp4820_c0_seq1:59-292(+)
MIIYFLLLLPSTHINDLLLRYHCFIIFCARKSRLLLLNTTTKEEKKIKTDQQNRRKTIVRKTAGLWRIKGLCCVRIA